MADWDALATAIETAIDNTLAAEPPDFETGKAVWSAEMAEALWNNIVVTEDWHDVGSGGGEPDFGAGWAEFTDPAFTPVAFKRHAPTPDAPYGLVEIKGLAKLVSGSSVVVFTLPTDYRPATSRMFAQITSVTAAGEMRVNTNGTVTCHRLPTINGWASMSCIFDPVGD